VLKKAKLSKAEMVVAVTDSDETNIVACLLASAQSSSPFKIARIRNPDLNRESALFDKNHLDIDLCINPEREAVNDVINLMEYSGALDVIDFAGGRVKLISFYINSDCDLAGKSLQQIREIHGGEGILVASIMRGDEPIIPSGKTEIRENDHLFVLARSEDVRDVLRFFGKTAESSERVFILGGGDIALMLAELLEKKGIDTIKIIEKDRTGAKYLLPGWTGPSVSMETGQARTCSRKKIYRMPITSLRLQMMKRRTSWALSWQSNSEPKRPYRLSIRPTITILFP